MKSVIFIWLNFSLFTFASGNIFTGSSPEPGKNNSSDSISIASIVKGQINLARKNPGRTSFVPDPIEEKKAGELQEEFFSFINRQIISLSSVSFDLKIKILSGIMLLLGITLIILIQKIHKMKKETGFIRYVKAIKEGMVLPDIGKAASNLNNIRKMLCENPVCLYDKLSKESGKNYSKAAKDLIIPKGEVQLSSKIKSYQISRLLSGENNLAVNKLNRGV